MTPLQYQKRLRLLATRNLLLAGTASAETAALQVGYVSASQFGREYARLFGAPPRRDIDRLRAPLRVPTAVRERPADRAPGRCRHPGPAVRL